MPVISYPRALALQAGRDPERTAIVHEEREIGRAAHGIELNEAAGTGRIGPHGNVR